MEKYIENDPVISEKSARKDCGGDECIERERSLVSTY
jgi:hypothetical protein